MGSLTKLITNLQNLNVIQVAADSLSEHTEQMADLNREQLMQGVDSSGGKIVPKYAPFRMQTGEFYAEMKNKMNAAPGFGTPDLKLTGSFHKSIKYQVNKTDVESISQDPHNLESKYSNGIFENVLKIGSESKKKMKPDLQKTSTIKVNQKLWT
jgi:hypothetical protein